MGFRGDGGDRQVADAGGVVRPYDDAVVGPARRRHPVDDERRATIKRFHLINHCSALLRHPGGLGRHWPYRLPWDGRTLIVRDCYRLGQATSGGPTSPPTCPTRTSPPALVLDDVAVRITDFGTASTTPEDYLDRLVVVRPVSPPTGRTTAPSDRLTDDEDPRAARRVRRPRPSTTATSRR